MGLIKNLKDKLTKKVDNFLAKKVEGVPPEIGTLSQEENEDETPKEGKSEDFDSGLNKEFKKEKKKNLLEDEEEPEEDEEDQEDEEQQQEKLQKKKQKINSKSNLTDRPIGEQFDEELRKVSKKSPKNKDASLRKKPSEINVSDNAAEEEIKALAKKSRVVFDELLIKIEKINAVLESFEAFKKFNSERISQVSEQIGELRSNIMNNERDIKTIEVSSTRAVDLVKEVQPEKLMTDIQRQIVRIDTLKTRLDGFEGYYKVLLDEIKNIKSKLTVFRGTEQILDLQESIKRDIVDVQKIKTIVEGHADKVEEIFINIKSDVASFEKLNILIKDLTDSFKGIKRDLDELRIKSETLAEKNELANLKTTVSSQLLEFDKSLSEFKNEIGDLNKIDYLAVKLASKIKKNAEDISDLSQRLTKRPDENKYITGDDLAAFKNKVSYQIKELDSSLKEMRDRKNYIDQGSEKEAIFRNIIKTNEKMHHLLGVVDKLSYKISPQNNFPVDEKVMFLSNYIKKALSMGYSIDDVRNEIIKSNWPIDIFLKAKSLYENKRKDA